MVVHKLKRFYSPHPLNSKYVKTLVGATRRVLGPLVSGRDTILLHASLGEKFNLMRPRHEQILVET